MSAQKLITEHIDLWTSTIKARNTQGRGSSKKRELYGIKKLRELILELAVRGKLVPQDPNDEPASVLLDRITAAKARLIKDRKITAQKQLPAITEEEEPFPLPTGWGWSRLGEVTNYGPSAKVEPQDARPDIWVLELEDVEKDTSKLLRKVRFCDREFKSSKNKFIEGDVIYGKLRPYLNKVLIADEDGVCTTEMIPIRAHAAITANCLRLIMKSPYFKEYANNSTHGMSLPRMGTDKARLALIPIVPEDEQHRIVAKVDELMALCDQLEQQTESSLDAHNLLVDTLLATLTDAHNANELSDNWARLADHFDTLITTDYAVEQLKQTILQLAVQGKLVPQDPNDEPASVLLKRIAAEKEQLIKDKKIKKQKPLSKIRDDEKPYKLPIGWKWCRLPDVGELARGKSKHRPRNDPSLYLNGDIPLVQTGDVSRANGVIETYTALYNEAGLAQSKLWPKGTMCITIAANIADTSVLGFDACFPDSVVGYTPFDDNFDIRYFEFFIRTAKNHLEEYAPSTAQKNINLEILSQLLVPCPPLKEISRIAIKVSNLMAHCDQLRVQLNEAQTTQLHIADSFVDEVLS